MSSLLTPLFDKGERDTILILLLAGAHFLQGDTDRGQAVLKAGIEKHPKEIAPHLQLAEAHLRAGDLKATQRVMETVRAIDPDNRYQGDAPFYGRAHAEALLKKLESKGAKG